MSHVFCPHECGCICHSRVVKKHIIEGPELSRTPDPFDTEIIHNVPCCEGLCPAGCGKYILVGRVDAHLQDQECHPTENKVRPFSGFRPVRMDKSLESKLRDLRKNIKRADQMKQVTPDIELLKILLVKLCPHLEKHVCQGPRGGWPNTYTRTCASCGMVETACDLNSFLVLKQYSQETSWQECERMKSLDIMTLKDIDPELM